MSDRAFPQLPGCHPIPVHEGTGEIPAAKIASVDRRRRYAWNTAAIEQDGRLGFARAYAGMIRSDGTGASEMNF